MTSDACCRKCGRVVDQPSRGRPKRFCSAGCRRSSELEVRRLDQAIARLEGELEACRFAETDSLAALVDVFGHNLEERQASISREIARYESRLRELLAE